MWYCSTLALCEQQLYKKDLGVKVGFALRITLLIKENVVWLVLCPISAAARPLRSDKHYKWILNDLCYGETLK